MPTIPNIPGAASHDYQIQHWFLEMNSEGAPISVIDFTNAAVQLEGNLGPGQCAIEGRLDGQHSFVQLSHGEGLRVDLRPGRLYFFGLMVAEIRPVLLHGDANTAVKVTVLLKR